MGLIRMGALAQWMPDRKRLHLQHGPSDLIVYAEGEREKAYASACARFQTVISELTEELPLLKSNVCEAHQQPQGDIALSMYNAVQHFSDLGYVTPMAAVAGAIADEILDAMKQGGELKRAYVNNGGDIAIFLSRGTSFETLISRIDGSVIGRITINQTQSIGGLATSGRHGRSMSLGIADSVTVLARSAALADVSATMISNAVNLENHPKILRKAAHVLCEDTDLRNLPVVIGCETLCKKDVKQALENGRKTAIKYHKKNLINDALLCLQSEAMAIFGESDYFDCLYKKYD